MKNFYRNKFYNQLARDKLILPAFAYFTRISAYFAVNKIILVHIIFFISCYVYCQEEELSDIITNIAEELAADESDPETATLFIEQLHELSEYPVRINSADESELVRLFFITDFQIKSLIDHIKESGDIVSIYEIASVPGFDRQLAEMMMPFISLVKKENNSPGKLKFRNNLLTNLIIKPGESDTSSLGSAWKILSKYKFSIGSFSGGITVEKDAGEKFFPAPQSFPDFISTNLTYTGKGFVRKIILGDYSARFGQGTNVNSRMSTGFSLTSSGYMSGQDEVRPYTSTDENNFFRGVAAKFSIRNLGLSLLYSNNAVDATLGTSADSTEKYVVNFYRTGLHNRSLMMTKKNILNEIFYGINVNYNISSVRFGLTWTENSFSLPLNLKSSDPDDLYAFKGIRNNVYSVYYNSVIKRILMFGEVSADKLWNFALVQGFTARPADRLSINFLYRKYSPGFISLHAHGPGISTSTGNEHGMLGNFTFEAAKYLFINAGFDITSFPWLKYRCSYPSIAKRKEIRIKYLPSDKFSFEMLYKYRFSMTDMQDDKGISGMAELTSRTFKGIVKYTPAENLNLTTRIDYKVVGETGSKGMLMQQDINYRFRQIPLTLWFRHCIFTTDDWNSRLFTWENDLLYSFSIPALSGKGNRSYLMVKWKIADIAELRIKYRLTTVQSVYYTAEESDEIKFQFRIWL